MKIDNFEREERYFKVIVFCMVVLSLLFLFYMGFSLCRTSKKIKCILTTTDTSVYTPTKTSLLFLQDYSSFGHALL